ncbi:MAG: hypothetical protein HY905_07675 [Deltaproteobacteria bacterium]|nr:hypothetical protein [Deltaproteobacteria bacterium]
MSTLNFPGLALSHCPSVDIGVIAGFLTRLAAVPLILDISVAIATTKIPLLLREGFWKLAHEARTDFAMPTGARFLALVGAGPRAVDGPLERRLRGG